jgi:REP element-mobilizing transposase RayT
LEKRPFAGQVADAVWTALMAERDLKHIDVLAACLMPDHLHVVARPGERAIGQWLALFKSYTTGLIRNAGGPRFIWQPSYYDRLVRNELELGDTLRYVIHNPVVAGLVERPEDWPWVWWTQMG